MIVRKTPTSMYEVTDQHDNTLYVWQSWNGTMHFDTPNTIRVYDDFSQSSSLLELLVLFGVTVHCIEQHFKVFYHYKTEYNDCDHT